MRRRRIRPQSLRGSIRRAGSGQGKTGCRSAAPRETSAPSARTASRLGIDPQRVRFQQPAKSLSAIRLAAARMPARRSGAGRGQPAPRFPRSSRGSAATVAASIPMPLAQIAVGLVDAAAGKDQGAGGERHPFGALDHQNFRAIGRYPVTRIRCRGGDRPRSWSRAASLHAADVLLLRVARVGGVVGRHRFVELVRGWAASAAASLAAASLAASIDIWLRSSLDGWFISALLTGPDCHCCRSPKARARRHRQWRKSVFSWR